MSLFFSSQDHVVSRLPGIDLSPPPCPGETLNIRFVPIISRLKQCAIADCDPVSFIGSVILYVVSFFNDRYNHATTVDGFHCYLIKPINKLLTFLQIHGAG